MTPDFGAGDPGPGLVAFLVVAFLCVATGLLLWSMVRQIRKVPKDLDVPLHPRAGLPHALDPSTGAGRDDVELPTLDAPSDPDPGGRRDGSAADQ